MCSHQAAQSLKHRTSQAGQQSLSVKVMHFQIVNTVPSKILVKVSCGSNHYRLRQYKYACIKALWLLAEGSLTTQVWMSTVRTSFVKITPRVCMRDACMLWAFRLHLMMQCGIAQSSWPSIWNATRRATTPNDAWTSALVADWLVSVWAIERHATRVRYI